MGCVCSAHVEPDVGNLPEGVEVLNAKCKEDVRCACDVLVRSFAGSSTTEPELSFDFALSGYKPELKENMDDPRRQKYLRWALHFVIQNALVSGQKGVVFVTRSQSGTINSVMALKINKSDLKGAACSITKTLCRVGFPSMNEMSFMSCKHWIAMELAYKRLHKAQVGNIPHLYVWAVAVDTTAQKQGIGRKLMNVAASVAAKHGLPMYLEAAGNRNKAIYEKFGFRVVGQEQLKTSGKNPDIFEEYYAMMTAQ